MKKPNIKRVVVCGLGSAGANWLMNMIHTHPDLHYVLVDDDVVASRNIDAGTQPYSTIDLNRPKVQAIQRIVRGTKNKKVDVVMERIKTHTRLVDLAGNPDEALLIDAFDNHESRNIFLKLPKFYNVLHIGFSAQLNGDAVWAEHYSEVTANPVGDVDVCLLRAARPFIIGLTAVAALVAMDFIDNGRKRNVYFDANLKLFTF